MIVIDGENCILGRLSTYAAKEALNGEDVKIVNAEKIIILGTPKTTVEEYRYRFYLRDPADPMKSPDYPKRPDMFVRRTIRGMLPWKRSTGKDAFRRVMAYMGVPKELAGKGKKVGELKDMHKPRITVEELCKNVGWKG